MQFTDATEAENGVDEGLLHAIELNDLKGATTPMSASAMMPSPILLWRFKVISIYINIYTYIHIFIDAVVTFFYLLFFFKTEHDAIMRINPRLDVFVLLL